MNLYETTFDCKCPANGVRVTYTLKLYHKNMVFVESLVDELVKFKDGYHELIADKLHNIFGGQQVITAHHHGIDITTWRGFDD